SGGVWGGGGGGAEPGGGGRARSPVPASGQVAAHLSEFPEDDAGPEGQPPERGRWEAPADRPSGLPRAADDFTGRQDVLGELLAFFDHGVSPGSGPPRFPAGVGPPVA